MKKQHNEMADRLSNPERGELKMRVEKIRECRFAIDEQAECMIEELLAIRDHRLYREHGTFKQFVAQEFPERSVSWVYRQLQADKVRASLPQTPKSKDGDNLSPLATFSEAQTRELAKVPEEQREAVLEWAEEKAGDKPVTAKIIREAIAEVAEAEPEDEDEIPDTTEDRMNAANKVLEAFAKSITALVAEAEKIDNAHLTDDKNGRLETLKAQLKSAAGTVRSAKGAGVCTYCDGTGCKHCLKTGWLTKTSMECAPEK